MTAQRRTPLAWAARVLVLAYRYTLSPYLGNACRYRPTCSEFALEAIDVHGGVKGGWVALRRVLRCNPWGGHGYDPVPPARSAHSTSARSPGRNGG